MRDPRRHGSLAVVHSPDRLLPRQAVLLQHVHQLAVPQIVPHQKVGQAGDAAAGQGQKAQRFAIGRRDGGMGLIAVSGWPCRCRYSGAATRRSGLSNSRRALSVESCSSPTRIATSARCSIRSMMVPPPINSSVIPGYGIPLRDNPTEKYLKAKRPSHVWLDLALSATRFFSYLLKIFINTANLQHCRFIPDASEGTK